MTRGLLRGLRVASSVALLVIGPGVGAWSGAAAASLGPRVANTVTSSASADGPVAPLPMGIPQIVGPPRRIDASHLPLAPRTDRAAPPRRFFRHPHGHAAAPRTQGVVTAALASAAASSAVVPKVFSRFTGMSEQQETSLFGLDQFGEPPDVQAAAGPSTVTEVVNSSASFWTTSGALIKAVDLYSFFAVPAGYFFSDPRVIYDAQSGRWFATGLSFDLFNDGQVYIAVSQTSDPTRIWQVYTIAANTAHTLYDQPFVGTSDDKVIVSWNDFLNNSTFTGQESRVLQKSDLLAGVSARATAFGPDPTRSRLVPAQSLTPTTTEYVVYNRETAIGVIAITGTPALGNVALSETDLPITPTSASPPPPQQPGGQVTTAIDDRFLGAVWQHGTLWTGASDGCMPAGDSTARTCPRLLELSTAGAAPTVQQDFDAGIAGASVYYPAVMLDSAGNLYVTLTISSPTTDPLAAVSGQLAGMAGSLLPVTTLLAGTAAYVGTRWGDYLGAAVDPNNPATVWVAGEYAASGFSFANWGTELGQVTLGTIGGKGFQISSTPSRAVAMTWTGGTVQTGYDILRLSSSGDVALPASGPLPTAATTFTDSSTLADTAYCYALLPLTGSSALGVSDVLCYVPRTRAGSAPPPTFAIQLNQSPVASLTWTAPGGQTGYQLVAVPLNGGAQRTQSLPASATSATDDTQGGNTCYVLEALAGSSIIGNTDVLCAIPGMATVAPTSGAALSGASVDEVQRHVRNVVDLKQMLPVRDIVKRLPGRGRR